jgi:hypothetical protein
VAAEIDFVLHLGNKIMSIEAKAATRPKALPCIAKIPAENKKQTVRKRTVFLMLRCKRSAD